MALSASSSCTKTVVAVTEVPKVTTSNKGNAPSSQAGGVLPLPVKPRFQSSALQRTKSRKPVKKGTAVIATLQEATVTTTPVVEESVGVSATPAVEALEDAAEVLEADVAPGAMRVRKSAGKANSRTSRRRALVMCLALGMVRPCASNTESNNSQQVTADLRRTASAMPALRRTASSFKATGSSLISQVSLATTMKQTNLLGEPEDLQKLTSLQ